MAIVARMKALLFDPKAEWQVVEREPADPVDLLRRYVQVRGMDASLNTLSIDGMRMPSPEPSARQTPMDVIPSDMVAAIQVSKTLTPDLDADAIGGNANLITRTARSGMPLGSQHNPGTSSRILRDPSLELRH